MLPVAVAVEMLTLLLGVVVLPGRVEQAMLVKVIHPV
jgi:hypothetical protein